MIAADRQHRGMHHGAAVKNDDIGGAAADIDQRDAEFALLGKQRRVGRGQRLEHQFAGRDARALAALGEILAVALRGGDDMDRAPRAARPPSRSDRARLPDRRPRTAAAGCAAPGDRAGSRPRGPRRSRDRHRAAPTSPPRTATIPWLLSPRICAPATPTTAAPIRTPETPLRFGAAAARIASTVASILTTTPLRNPRARRDAVAEHARAHLRQPPRRPARRPCWCRRPIRLSTFLIGSPSLRRRIAPAPWRTVSATRA